MGKLARASISVMAVLVVPGCSPIVEPTEASIDGGAVTVESGLNVEPLSRLDCDFSDHASAALESVWQIHAGNSSGTAFHIGDGQWLTAEHVISGHRTVTLHNGGSSMTATVSGSNKSGDTALLVTSISTEPPRLRKSRCDRPWPSNLRGGFPSLRRSAGIHLTGHNVPLGELRRLG